MMRVDSRIIKFTMNDFNNLRLTSRFWKQDLVQVRITVPVTDEVMVRCMVDNCVDKLEVAGKFVQKVGSLRVAVINIEISAQKYGNIRVTFTEIIKAGDEGREIINKANVLAMCREIYGHMDRLWSIWWTKCDW